MKKCLIVLLLLSLRAPARGAGATRIPAEARPIRSAPYPPEAASRKIEGNVVLTGTVTAAGTVTGLHAIASSSPVLTPAAIGFVSQWKFAPATEGGKPIPVTLNAVVRFRKDSRAIPGVGLDPGTLAFPMVGNLVLSPGGPDGVSRRLEGFPVEPQDGSITGTLDLDFPKTLAPKSYRVVVTDAFPSGRQVAVFDQPVSGGKTEGAYAATVTFHRAIRAGDPAEAGTHLVSVKVDGRDAGGGAYAVAGAPRPAKRKTK